MSEDKQKSGEEEFLTRWSRLKQQAREQPAATPPAVDPEAPPPELPPLDELTIESDFSGFFHPKVDENLRRAALKKLFSDPHFNVMDGLDVYIDDYSKPNPLPATMLAGLRQAQQILEWAKTAKADSDKQAAASPAEANIASPPAEQAALPVPEAAQPAKDQLRDAVLRDESQIAPERKS